MLDPGSKQILEHILAKDPAIIDELDREFLTARRAYLSEAQMKQFGIVEPETEATPKEEVVSAPAVEAPVSAEPAKVEAAPAPAAPKPRRQSAVRKPSK